MDTESWFAPCDPSKAYILVSTPAQNFAIIPALFGAAFWLTNVFAVVSISRSVLISAAVNVALGIDHIM